MTLYLSGFAGKEAQANQRLGFLLTPSMGNLPADLLHRPWAADTGCFTLGERFEMGAYITWLTVRMKPYQFSCLFVTAPDVVGNAKKTWEKSAPWLDALRHLGWKVALVAQNGIEHTTIEWDRFDALFIGGSTRWKVSPVVEWLVKEAKSRGKYVHMGRVNSWKRLWLAHQWGCDSVDGTFLVFGPAKNTPRVERWLNDLERFQQLWQTHQTQRPTKPHEPISLIFGEAEEQIIALLHRLAQAQPQLPFSEQPWLMSTLYEFESLRDTLIGWNEAIEDYELAS